MQEQILFETAQRIFEEAAFAFVDYPSEEECDMSDDKSISCMVGFSGPFTGRMIITSSEALARTVAANMMGVEEDDEDSEKKCKDALGEILNMICGNLLPAIAGTKVEFRIGAPTEISQEEKSRLVNEHSPELLKSARMNIEDCETELLFLTDSEIKTGAING